MMKDMNPANELDVSGLPLVRRVAGAENISKLRRNYFTSFIFHCNILILIIYTLFIIEYPFILDLK